MQVRRFKGEEEDKTAWKKQEETDEESRWRT